VSDDVTDQGRDLTGDDWQAITVALVARLLPHGGEVCIVPEDFVAVAGKVLSVKMEIGTEAQASITLSLKGLKGPRVVVGEAVRAAVRKGRLQ